MSSLMICRNIEVSADKLKKMGISGSLLDPADLTANGSAGSQDRSEDFKRLTELLDVSERRDKRTALVTKAVAVGSLMIAAVGLWISWRRYTNDE
jgi:hypothetical protein